MMKDREQQAGAGIFPNAILLHHQVLRRETPKDPKKLKPQPNHLAFEEQPRGAENGEFKLRRTRVSVLSLRIAFHVVNSLIEGHIFMHRYSSLAK